MRIDHDMVDRPTVLSPIYGPLQQGAAPSNLNYDPEYLEESTPSVTVVAIAFDLTSSVSCYSNGQTGFWYLQGNYPGKLVIPSTVGPYMACLSGGWTYLPFCCL